MNDFFDGFASFDLAKRLAITGLLVTLATSVGFTLLIVPGLYLMMAFAYAPLLVVDRGAQPRDALRLSFEQVNARFGTHCAIFALLGAIVLAGSLVCGVGLLVALPVALVAVPLRYGRAFGIRDGVDKLR